MPPRDKKRTSKGKGKRKAPSTMFKIDCTVPVDDKVFDTAHFEKYLNDHVKVAGRTGNLGDTVGIARKGSTIVVSSKAKFSKRSLKYYTKRYLKKNHLRDWLRVVASDKQTYELRYFNIRGDEEEEEEEDEE